MIGKLAILLCLLIVLVFIGYRVLRKSITPYKPLTWTIIEFTWYMISFAAVCVGLIELERIEKLDLYKESEKQLQADYYNKKGLLHAQTWLLKINPELPPEKSEGIRWFHVMKGLFDEGLHTSRWEGFLNYSRSYVLNEKGVYADPLSSAIQYQWPLSAKFNPEKIYLKEEISWVVDTLKSFRSRKEMVAKLRPEENTNYSIRYVLICLFLVGLSLKILKIYADYKKSITVSNSKT